MSKGRRCREIGSFPPNFLRCLRILHSTVSHLIHRHQCKPDLSPLDCKLHERTAVHRCIFPVWSALQLGKHQLHNKQWDPAVQHWELYLVTYNGALWKIMWEKGCIYVCMTGSLCYTVENWQNTVNQLYNGKHKNHFKKSKKKKEKRKKSIWVALKLRDVFS